MAHEESAHTCACGGSCGCQSTEESQNTYLTREQYIVQLEQYLVDLKSEISLVEQELMQLKTPVELAKV